MGLLLSGCGFGVVSRQTDAYIWMDTDNQIG